MNAPSDMLTVLRTSAHDLHAIPDATIHAIITSPPYYALRSYSGDQDVEWPTVEYRLNEWTEPITVQGCDPNCTHEWVDGQVVAFNPQQDNSGGLVNNKVRGQRGQQSWTEGTSGKSTQGRYCTHCGGWRGPLGLEPSPVAYIGHLILCLREWKRVLRDDGTIWVNLGDSFSSLQSSPKRYIIREDISKEEKYHVAMAMLGMWFDRDKAPRKGIMQELLQALVRKEPARERPGMAFSRREADVSEAQAELCRQAEEASPRVEMGSHREVGREVCLLRGDDVGVLDSGSCQWRRSGTSPVIDGEQQSQFGSDIQGHQESGVSTGQVPDSVLQLQLLDWSLGLLSSYVFEDDEIPGSVRKSFTVVSSGPKPKNLLGIPWMFAFAARADGWYLRSDIIWSKPNPMPESVTDRPTKAHEYVFLLAKSSRYYFDADAVREDAIYGDHHAKYQGTYTRHKVEAMQENGATNGAQYQEGLRRPAVNPYGRNIRTVWSIATQPYPGAHYAVFPERLVEPMIKAATSERGCCSACGAPHKRVMEKSDRVQAHWPNTEQVHAKAAKGKHGATSVIETGSYQTYSTLGWQPTCTCDAGEPVPCKVLDPFSGSGTTARVAIRLGRHAIVSDISNEYLSDHVPGRTTVQMEML